MSTENDEILRNVGGRRLSYNVTIVPLSIEGKPQKLDDLRAFIHSLTTTTQIYAARTPEEWDYCILRKDQPRLDNAFRVFSHFYRSKEGLSIPGQLNRFFYSSCCRAYRRLVGEDLPEYETARLVAALSGECGYCPSPLMPTWRWFEFFKKTGLYKTPDDEYPKYYVQSEQEQKDTRWHLEDFVYSQRRLSQEPLEVRKAYQNFARDVLWRRNDETDITRLSYELDELEWKEGHKAVVFVQADAMEGLLHGIHVDRKTRGANGDQQTTLKKIGYPPGNSLIISNLSAAAAAYLFRGRSFLPKMIAGATVAGWVSVGVLCRSVSLANNALTRMEHKFGDSMLAEAIEADAMSGIVTQVV
ncbi:hypothetical protein FOL47_008577 [Perkinsus chesapeaki]|uniref:Uncharacterized protein n=1 Tax=Perkinsus chesapeaki TaxID=330153 RepID=A0A7J6LD62_PERCH|nr:hypothetical protein FOL47_008577 [Perkinsus chesapeaki]